MPIRLKLILTYLKISLISIALILIVSIFWSQYYFSGYGQLNKDDKSPRNPLKSSYIIQGQIYSELKKTALLQPYKLEETDYLSSFEDKLNKIFVGIVVRKNSNIIYFSPGDEIIRGSKTLPSFANFTQNVGTIFGNHKSGLIIGQHDFYFSDGGQGSIFLISKDQTFNILMRNLNISMLISIILILGLTNIAMVILFGRSIANPISRLKDGANLIKAGNFDIPIYQSHKKKGTVDEIEELNIAFEEMRLRLKESLEVQKQYEENRKDLIANISHDLKTPITAVKGYIRGIRDGVADSPEKMDKYLSTIERRTDELDNLINGLFLYSKLDLHKEIFNFTDLRLDRFFIDLVEELSYELEKERIKLDLYEEEIRGELVNADVQQIKRVVVNIVENSVKYKGDRPLEIKIRLSNENASEIKISIADNGEGIGSEALPHIFSRFYRADESRGADKAGSGLGLSIARKIVEEHDGKIWAKSKLGEGTIISFTLKKKHLEKLCKSDS